MKDRYVIDTNVLIAASAAMAMRSGKPLLPHHQEVTPQDAGQLEKVLDWLLAFEQSDSRLVLDNAGLINVEYHHKLDFYDYGIQVVMLKLSREQIEAQLYSELDGPLSNAVDSAICQLRRKLTPPGTLNLIQTRRGQGYVLEAPPP